MTRPILHRQSGSSGAHPSDRAATPSEPSQSSVVSGVAGIPCAFTPGPWLSDEAPDMPEVWDANEYMVAECFYIARHRNSEPSIERPEDELLANASLIAAAPNLYEACRLFEVAANMSVFDDSANAALAKAHEAAQAALAKARGQ